jgi:hypothetical protein
LITFLRLMMAGAAFRCARISTTPISPKVRISRQLLRSS